MDNKKTIMLIVILIVLIILVVILFDILGGFSSNGDNSSIVIDKITDVIKRKDTVPVSDEDKEQAEKYPVYMENSRTKSLTIEEKKGIIKVLDEILNNVNSRSYDELFEKLNYNYKLYKFSNKEEFIRFFDELTKKYTDYTCNYYDVKFYGYTCEFSSKSSENKFYISLNINIDETYDIIFEPYIVEINNISKVFFINNTTICKIVSEIFYEDNLIYILDITNTLDKNINVSLEGTTAEWLFRGNSSKKNLINEIKPITILPQKTGRFELMYNIEYSDSNKYDILNLNSKINGKMYNNNMNMNSFNDTEF